MCLLTIPNFGIIGKVAVLVCEFVILLVSPRASDYTRGRGACLMPCCGCANDMPCYHVANCSRCTGSWCSVSGNYSFGFSELLSITHPDGGRVVSHTWYMAYPMP